ncbi:MAG: PDZ domain-containing protein [Okeania sp. SIO2H7]|nr:PDZ domain-containing protein [Okeania sp. SIO2H7]
MKDTKNRTFWKQPVLSLLLLLTGGAAALLGQDLIRPDRQISSADYSNKSDRSLAPASDRSNKGNSYAVGMPTWLSVNNNIPAENFIVEAVDLVGPAVVRINASRSANNSRSNRFGGEFPENFGFRNPRNPNSPVEEGTGSGFILSSEGHILTNAHVVEGAETVDVILKDGRQYLGKVLGTDDVTDVAVVKIEADNLPKVTIGNSEELKPGEWAIAIGNPLGLDNSVTIGIISATGRSSMDVGVPDKRVGFIQTDAAINPGNSGGPLLNDRGQVIGMNTAIVSGAQGLGFAIPINSAMRVADQLIVSGDAEHAFLGIAMQTITSDLKREFNSDFNSKIRVNSDRGVLIVQVIPGSPADRHGLRSGDVILNLDGEDIYRSETVQQLVQAKAVGSAVRLEIDRDGEILNILVPTGNLPAEFGG